MYYQKTMATPLGSLYLVSDEHALKGVWFEGQKYFARTIRETPLKQDNEILRQTEDWLRRYFAGQKPDPDELPLDPDGTVYQKAVWQVLLAIPYGQTRTYREVAIQAARLCHSAHPGWQAAGGAVGHNPISVIIPCHRVLGSDGSLTGYAGGVWRKQKLLELEGALPAAE